MKKKKILVLFPVLGLLLSGCTFQEGLANAKSWVSQHIYHPIKDWISGGGNKEEPSDGGGDTEVTISSIGIASYKEEVAMNYEYKTSDVKIRVYYSDGNDEEKAPESVACDTSKEGDTTLTVTYKGFTKTATVKVLSESEVVHVEEIRWDVSKRTLHVGESVTITVTVSPENATDKSVVFKSDKPEILTVSDAGVVEAKAVGSATVTITPNDNASLAKQVSFTVAEQAASLPEATKNGYNRLAASETLKNGEKINVAGAIGEKYYVMPAYSSGNNIPAKVVELQEGKLAIDEADEFTVIANDDGSISLLQADGKYLSACGDAEGKNYLKVVSSIDDTAKFSVSVDADGNAQLQAKKVERGYLCLNPNKQYGNPLFGCYRSPDNFEKYAIYHDGKGSSEHVAVESVAFAQASYSVEKGRTVEVLASVSPALASDRQVSYEIKEGSANPAGCITLAGNVVTGVEEGSAVIVAKSHEDPTKTAEATITVTPAVERNYGTLESPLTIAQAKQVIDLDDGKAAQPMYVKGKVSKNDAYNSQYKNTNVWLTDGVNEFELYGALMPEGFSPAQPAKNDAALVGKTVVAHGSGKLYGTTYEFDKNCQIDSVTEEALPVISIDSLIENSATGIPETIEKGKTLSVGNISVGVNLSDGSEGTTHPDSIELNTESTGVAQGKLIISTGTTSGKPLEYAFTITVIDPVQRNYGTLENPLTVSEAFTLIEETCPNNGDFTEEQIYCEGSVTAIGDEQTYGFQNVKVSDGVKELLIYSLNMSAEQKADFAVGRTIKFHGYAKNYSGTLEFATKKIDNVSNYVTVDEVIAEVVPVSGVTLDKNELNMEVGLPDETLVATVAPENASNKNVLWESSNPEAATVTDGVVHAVAAGDAVITVKSAADNSKTATCNVHVTAAQKQLDGISIKTNPKVAYNEGDLLDLSDMVVTLHYDDESTVDINSGWTTNIAANHPLTSEDTSLIVSYGGFSANISLTISGFENIIAPGTYLLTATEDEVTYYLKSNGSGSAPSAVTSIYEATPFEFSVATAKTNEYYIKDGDNYLYATDTNNGVRVGGTECKWIIEEGTRDGGGYDMYVKISDTVNRYLSLYNKADFRTYTAADHSNRKVNTNVAASITRTLESIAVTTAPTKLSYLVGETFDPSGLVVTAHYELSNNTTEDVILTAEQYELSFSGAFTAQDVAEEKAITVSFGGKETYFNVSVAEPVATLTSISIEGDPQAEYTEGDSYSYEGLTAIAHYSDESTIDVTGSAEWGVSKAKAEVGDDPITISASYGGKTGELVVPVTVSEKAQGVTTTYTFSSSWNTSKNITQITEDEFVACLVSSSGQNIITGYEDNGVTNAYVGSSGGSGTNAWNLWNSLKIGKGSGGAGSIVLSLDSTKTFSKIQFAVYGWDDTSKLSVNGTEYDISTIANKTNINAGNAQIIEVEVSSGASTLTIGSGAYTEGNHAIVISSITFVA